MTEQLAIQGGKPIRETLLPYGRQSVSLNDISEVIEVLKSDWLTTGVKIPEFEQAVCKEVQADHAVAVSSGTAALHAAMYALQIKPGDEVIVPAMTFAATANCVVYQGGKPIFCDVDKETLLIDPDKAEKLITENTQAIIAVDYAGQPCDYQALETITSANYISLVSDACHSLGAKYYSRPVGSLADLNIFSFHPVKGITTGEGGMITTDSELFANRMRMFRNHGITSTPQQRTKQGTWFYEMVDLGYNYRLTDIQCALGISQLKRLPEWIEYRQEIAKKYDAAFKNIREIAPLKVKENISHAFHLYIVKFDTDPDQKFIFDALRGEGIGVNVHYIPVHMHPYYRNNFKTGEGQCPVAESAYKKIISLPVYPSMGERDVSDVIAAVIKVLDVIR